MYKPLKDEFSVIYEGNVLNLGKEILNTMAEEIKKQVDLAILYKFYIDSGWHGATISYEQLDEVIAWVEQNAVGEVKWFDIRVAFAESKDYEWFMLRWG
jgi:hypothetical protein